jgi:hypothetical protein
MQQAEPCSLLVDPAWQLPVSLSYFVNAPVCLADTIAGLADTVLSQPDEGLRQQNKHDVFTDSSPHL